MKITDVRLDLIDVPALAPFQWRDGLPGSEPDHVEGWLVIETDEGVTGRARCLRGVIMKDLVERRLRTELLGQDALARELLWHRMWELDRIEEFPIYTIGAVDVALWDLAGIAAGMPVHRLLGSYRQTLPAYASTVTYGSIAEYLDVIDQCLASGYPAIKLHAWGDAARDIALIGAVREHVGDDVPLMYDGSAGFDLPDAIAVGRALSRANYLWYEEPMREFNLAAHRRLADAVDVPLLVPETADGAHMNTADFLDNASATFVRACPTLRGGITGSLRIAHLADAYLTRAEIHGGGLPSLHLCMAIRNTTYYEAIVHGNPIEAEPWVVDGVVSAPTAAGIGWQIPG